MSTVASTMPTALPAEPAWIPSPLYRMTVEEYEAMVASGAFKGRNRFQLISGLLVARMTQNPPHTIADILCGDELIRVIPPGWHVRPAKPVRLPGQATMNEPDRCVVRGSARNYLGQHPGPADIGLIVEVADSSLADDRELGAKVYGPAESRSFGSSTWSTARSRSTRAQVRAAISRARSSHPARPYRS
jgi:Uma2 family endonuclease